MEALTPNAAPSRRNPIPGENTSRRPLPVRSVPRRETRNNDNSIRKTDIWRTENNVIVVASLWTIR